MLNEFIVSNFAPLVGLLFLMIFLFSSLSLDEKLHRVFVELLVLEIIEMIVYNMEQWTASFAEPGMWRMLLAAIGYAIRPIMLLFILQLVAHSNISKKQMVLLSIPALINVVAAFSVFFTDVVYSYNEQKQLVRGPLGYVTHIVVLFYLAYALALSVKEIRKNRLECVVVWSMVLVIVLAVGIEAICSVRSIGRSAIVCSTLVYYFYLQMVSYKEDRKGYAEQKLQIQKEHLREMNIIGMLANEYVTVCYVDGEKDIVTPYRMASFIEEKYGDILRSGVTFEQIFKTYITQNVLEEDREFFLSLANLQDMLSYLRQNGSISQKYRVLRDGKILYCEMKAEIVHTDSDVDDIVFGFSNNDTRVRKEMIYQTTVQQEIDRVEKTKKGLSDIAELARQLQEAIEDKLSE